MDTLDCPSLELSDHSLRSTYACRLCVELGDNGCSRPVCGGGGSLHRSLTSDLYASECPGIGYCLALGATGRNDCHSSPTGSAFVASHSESAHSRFPPFSDSLSSVDDSNHSRSIIPDLLVAIKIGGNPCERSLGIRVGVVSEPGPHRGLPAGAAAPDRAADAAQASPESPSSAGVGAPASVSESVSQGADAAQSRVDARRS
jgi:hypothetical protein